MSFFEDETNRIGRGRKQKTYLDLFLDSQIKVKKRGIYFAEEQENAVIKYNQDECSAKEKNSLFDKIIAPAFKDIVNGVLEMPMFRNLGKLNRSEVADNTFFRLIEKMHKFQPGKIGKSGQLVKAYSYFSTIAKHYILEQKLRNEKILKNKADVETSIDLSILSEDTLEKMSNYDKQEVEFEDYVTTFKHTQNIILDTIFNIIHEEEIKEKRDEDFIKVGYYLKYLIEKWDKIEFMKKNEFMRILTLYTGFPQQKVSFLFKRYKTECSKKIRVAFVHKTEKKKSEEDEELFFNEEIGDVAENGNEEIVQEEKEIPDDYVISSMEEYEQLVYKFENKNKREEWARKIKKSSPE